MQNRAFSTCQRVLTLGLGVGGMLNVLCTSALSQMETELLSTTKDSDQVLHRPKAQNSKAQNSKAQQQPTQISSREKLPMPLALIEVVGSVEGVTAPRFSPRVCHQAACLTGTTPTLTLATDEIGSAIPLISEPDLKQSLEPKLALESTPKPEQASELEQQSETSLESLPEALEGRSLAVDTTHLDIQTDAQTAPDLAVGILKPFGQLATEISLEAAEIEAVEGSDLAQDHLEALPGESSSKTVLAQRSPAEVPNFLDVGEDPAEPDASTLDDELGTLRLQQTRSRSNEELGILRLMQTAQAPPPPPRQPIAFLGGRLGFFNTSNAFRSEVEVEEQIYQSGLALYLLPKISEKTSLYAIAETNLARYEVDYNELEIQAGLRRRLLPRTFAQIGWRNQRLYTPGYREKIVSVNYLDALISHRRVLSKRAWADAFYQIRLGFADPAASSRFRQTIVTSINYAPTPKLRTSLLYQLEFDDYLRINRYDISQQFIGAISYNVTPESRISLFGGTRFGSSSAPGVELDDVFYGAGLNVNVPLF